MKIKSWLPALVPLAIGIAAIFIIAAKITALHYDSYFYLNGARAILGWKGMGLQVFGHPLISFLYSRLLLFSQTFKDPLIELRIACLFSAAVSSLALCIAAVWLRKTFENRPGTWALCVLFLSVNALTLELAAWPLSDLMAMGLAAGFMILSVQAALSNNRKMRYGAAVLLGLSVCLKYQLWAMALVAIVYELSRPGTPLRQKLFRAIPYAALSPLIAAGLQSAIWLRFHPEGYGPGEMLRGFIAIYSAHTVEAKEPWWIYAGIAQEYFGWPLIAAAILGVFSCRKENDYVKANAVWALIYFFSLMIYEKQNRYLTHLLPALSVLAVQGISKALSTVRASPLIGRAVVFAMLAVAGLKSIEKFAWLTSANMRSPYRIAMGQWVRQRLQKENRLIFIGGGGAPWIAFISQRFPLESRETHWETYGYFHWPLSHLAQLRDRDILVVSPRENEYECFSYQAHIQDIELPKKGKSMITVSSSGESLELNEASGPYERWILVSKTGNSVLIPPQERKLFLGKKFINGLVYIRKIRFEYRYHPIG